MGCRRLLGARDRAVIMAGLEAGLSQGLTPRQISALPVRGAVWHTAPEPPSATTPPPMHSTNSLLPPIDTAGCYNQYPATCEDKLSNSLLLREKISFEGVARCSVDVVAVLHDASGGIVCRALRREQGGTAMLGQELGLLGGSGTRPDDLPG